MITRKTALIPALASLLFALIALVLIPYPGIQNDEVFFAGAIYSPDTTFYSADILGHKIPCMVMSYSGALKSWIFAGLWGYLFDPNPWSLRLPVVMVGIGTLLLCTSIGRSARRCDYVGVAGDRYLLPIDQHIRLGAGGTATFSLNGWPDRNFFLGANGAPMAITFGFVLLGAGVVG